MCGAERAAQNVRRKNRRAGRPIERRAMPALRACASAIVDGLRPRSAPMPDHIRVRAEDAAE
jgi:hypothetical protein